MTKSPRSTGSGHPWTFLRLGGLDQASLATAADLLALGELDQKLWVALSCPVTGLELDEKTLALIDTDGDGRIRPPEVIAAAQWAAARLREPAELLQGSAELPLASIAAESPDGGPLLAAARQILGNRGKPGAAAISIEDFSDPAAVFAPGRINGDGVIPLEAAADEPTRALIADIAACLGLTQSRAGSAGVTPAQVETFFGELQAYAEWTAQGKSPVIAFLGEHTGAAHVAIAAVRGKVADYFTRCRLAAFDPAAEGPLNPGAAGYLAFADRELSEATPALAALPLARIAPELSAAAARRRQSGLGERARGAAARRDGADLRIRPGGADPGGMGRAYEPLRRLRSLARRQAGGQGGRPARRASARHPRGPGAPGPRGAAQARCGAQPRLRRGG